MVTTTVSGTVACITKKIDCPKKRNMKIFEYECLNGIIAHPLYIEVKNREATQTGDRRSDGGIPYL